MTALCGIFPPDIPCFFKAAIQFLYNNTVERLLEGVQHVIIQLISKACDVLLRVIGDIWTSVDTPTLAGLPALDAMHVGIKPVQYAIVAVSIVVAAVRLGWTRRGEAVRELAKSLVTLVLVSLMAVAIVDLLCQAGDAFSKAIIKGALAGDGMGDSMSQIIDFGGSKGLYPGATAGTALAFTLVVIIGITAILVALIQIALMFVRMAGLIIVTVMLPVSVSATNTEIGQRWFRRTLGYLIMFILYKPAAATVYATAIAMVEHGGTAQPGGEQSQAITVVNVITGVTLMVLSVFLMPALMRLAVPPSSR